MLEDFMHLRQQLSFPVIVTNSYHVKEVNLYPKYIFIQIDFFQQERYLLYVYYYLGAFTYLPTCYGCKYESCLNLDQTRYTNKVWIQP